MIWLPAPPSDVNPLHALEPPHPPENIPRIVLPKFADNYRLSAHNGSMIEKQTKTAIHGQLPQLCFFLTTNHYSLTTASPAHTRSMIGLCSKTARTRITPCLRAFLTTNHYPLTTVFWGSEIN